jgi:cholesterol transport system auxiliary component
MKTKLILTTAFVTWGTLGCALTSKSEAISARYFSPEPDAASAGPAGKAPAQQSAARASELRLGRVEHASYLDERMVYRDSSYELGYYTERRWTESPEEYLKRELSRTLFERRGVRRVLGGAAPTLEVELTAFEEIRAPKHLARVRITAQVEDARVVRWMDTFTVDEPIDDRGDKGGDAASATAAAMGKALRSAVAEVADRVIATLDAPPPPDAGPVTANTR